MTREDKQMRILLVAIALLLPVGLIVGAEHASAIKSPLALVEEARASITEISHTELAAHASKETVLIDVREPNEYEEGHIPGAVNIPRGTLEFHILDHPVLADLAERDSDRLADTEIFVYCRSGKRAALAAQTLEAMGFREVFSLEGGFVAWREGKHPIER